MSGMSHQFDPTKHTLYTPENPEKYKGSSKPICRSSGEVKFCRGLDVNPNVLEGASEAIPIPYFDPVQSKKRQYFPDFYMKARDQEGIIKRFLIEVKPSKETKAPKPRKNKKLKNLVYEQRTGQTNEAKGKAALQFCKLHGIEFKILTEHELFK